MTIRVAVLSHTDNKEWLFKNIDDLLSVIWMTDQNKERAREWWNKQDKKEAVIIHKYEISWL